MAKTEIKSGSKLGPWAFSTCILTALALLAFGFSEDKAAIHRDALLEIQILTRGPNKNYQEYCRSAFNDNYDGVRKTFLQPIVNKINKFNSLIGNDKVEEFTPLFICPYPNLDGTLKDVLNYIMRSPTAYFMVPSAEFFQEIEANSISSVSEFGFTQFKHHIKKKGMERAIEFISDAIKRNQLTGFTRIGAVAFQSQKEKDFVNGRSCGNEHHHFFQELTEENLREFFSVIIDGYCISPEWKDLDNYFQIRPLTSINFQRTYFSSIARHLKGYSRYNEKDDLPRSTGLFGEAGDNGFEGSTPGGFDFPALSARLYELGDYKFENATKRIKSDFAALDSNWDIFGVKLPTLFFIVATISSFIICNMSFMWAIDKAKLSAFPEVIQDTPIFAQRILSLVALSALPAASMKAAASRLHFEMPSVALQLDIFSIVYVIATIYLWIRFALPHLRADTYNPEILRNDDIT